MRIAFLVGLTEWDMGVDAVYKSAASNRNVRINVNNVMLKYVKLLAFV